MRLSGVLLLRKVTGTARVSTSEARVSVLVRDVDASISRLGPGTREHLDCSADDNPVTLLPFAEPRPPRRGPEWQQVYVDDRRVEVLALGEGEPLLFLHGWGLSPRAYLPALRSLVERGHRITAPSLPGFGRSDARRNRDHSLHGVADHMIEALDALALPHRLPVVAHSFGAGISLRIAALRPDLIGGLTLISPAGGAGHGPATWPRLVSGLFDEASPHVAVATLRDFVPAALRNPAAITATGMAARAADSVTDLQRAVAAGIPVHLVFAAEDQIVRPGDLATCAPGATSETISGRHGWLLGEPQRFADLVTRSPNRVAVVA
jgi:pimeloyl-ACP methyl ester carboxylesterase